MQAFGEELARVDDPHLAAAIRFQLLTGWRVGEARGLKWEHVDLEAGEIVLPSSKTGPHTRMVAALVLEVLADVPRISGNPYVFPGSRSAPIGYKRLRAGFVEICRKAGVENCRMQDIRRTMATSAAASGMSVFMLRDLMNHKTIEMANRYARRAGEELQQAHDSCAERMDATIAGRRGEVVPMERRNAS